MSWDLIRVGRHIFLGVEEQCRNKFKCRKWIRWCNSVNYCAFVLVYCKPTLLRWHCGYLQISELLNWTIVGSANIQYCGARAKPITHSAWTIEPACAARREFPWRSQNREFLHRIQAQRVQRLSCDMCAVQAYVRASWAGQPERSAMLQVWGTDWTGRAAWFM